MDAQHTIQFDLTPEEMKLNILSCEPRKGGSTTSNVTSVDPKDLSKLPFPDQAFNLALCANVLLLNDEQQNLDFQLNALLELARVAGEVRVFPVQDKAGQPSKYLGPILLALQDKGLGAEIRQIKKGDKPGSAMLRFWNESCQLE